MSDEMLRGPYPALSRAERDLVACAWSDFRKDYGVPADAMARAQLHVAFVHGWTASLNEKRGVTS